MKRSSRKLTSFQANHVVTVNTYLFHMQVQTPPRDHLNHPSPFNQSHSNHNNRKRSLSPLPCTSIEQSLNNNANKRARYNDDSNNNKNVQNLTNEGSIDSNQAVNSIIMLVQERDALKEENKVLKVADSTTKNRMSQLQAVNDGLNRQINELHKAHKDEKAKLQQLLIEKRQEHCKKIKDMKAKSKESHKIPCWVDIVSCLLCHCEQK